MSRCPGCVMSDVLSRYQWCLSACGYVCSALAHFCFCPCAVSRPMASPLKAAHAARGLPHSRASSTLIITRRGHVYPAQGIPSALPLHDIVLYSLPATPINAQPGGHLPLTSVPVALYPPHIGTKQHLLLVGHDTWHETSVVGYKDPRGNDVEVKLLLRRRSAVLASSDSTFE